MWARSPLPWGSYQPTPLRFLVTTGQNWVSGICLSLCSPCFKVSVSWLEFPGGRPAHKGTEPFGLHWGSKDEEHIGEEPRHSSSCQPPAQPQMLLSILQLRFTALSWRLFFLPGIHNERWKNTIAIPSVRICLSIYILLSLGFHKP